MKAKDIVKFLEPFPDAEVRMMNYLEYEIGGVDITIDDNGNASVILEEKKKTEQPAD